MTKNLQKNKKELMRLAAIEIISEYGFYDTTISQIAEEAGVAVGTIYNYFDNKEEILEFIFEIEVKKRLKYLKMVEKSDKNFWLKIEEFLNRHFKDLKENTNTAKILVREKEFPRKTDSGAIEEYRYKIPEKLKKLMDKAINENKIRDCNTDVMSSVFFGAIQGVVEKAVKDENFELLDKAPLELIKILKKGIKN